MTKFHLTIELVGEFKSELPQEILTKLSDAVIDAAEEVLILSSVVDKVGTTTLSLKTD